MQRVHVEHRFGVPVERAFAHLAEHEHLEPLFGAKIRRVRDGDDGHRNGRGSVRALRVGPLPAFDETITEYVPDQLIRYRITRGGVLRDHEGVMRFSPDGGGGSKLDYTIVFRGRMPLIGPLVEKMLDRNIRRGLRNVDGRA